MFTLLRSMSVRRLLIEQLPAFVIAFIIADLFYKFHSFALETGAFLLTWLALDAVIQFVARMVRAARNRVASIEPPAKM